GESFITSKNKKEAFFKIQKILKRKDIETIEKSFNIFEKKFNIWWKMGSKIISKNKKIIENELNNKRTKIILNQFKTFFDSRINLKETTIYLLAHPCPGKFGGGANIGENGITLEINNLKPKSSLTEYTLGIIFHELCHLHFINEKHLKLIKQTIIKNKIGLRTKFFKEKMSPLTVINETIIESLVPKGYIGVKYLHSVFKKTKPAPINIFSDFRQVVLQKNISLTEKYITTGRSVDKDFVDKITKILKSTKKKEVVKNYLF
ncbi:MAG: hypothetical protein NUV87_04200, partial [Candidatus Roizmanbacteria bacterium]|nr:hypothetical protein [Candidatus Roizmanbacteria bacterium]